MKNLKIFAKTIDDKALAQINELMDQSAFENSKIRIMPDVHAGSGCVIGFTGDLGNKVIANVVGVDIGCGMLTVELGNVDIDFKKLDSIIRSGVPCGFNVHDNAKTDFHRLKELKCYAQIKDGGRLNRGCGTLGGGNHFIEIDLDDQDNKYLVIHSGSRNLGKQVADFYQNVAIDYNSGRGELKAKKEQLIADLKKSGRSADVSEEIKWFNEKNKDLLTDIPKAFCYLEGLNRDNYLHDMNICQEYASLSRKMMANTILENYFTEQLDDFVCFGKQLSDFVYFETVHNYISFEDNIVRKGAISARLGEKVLIPMNMRDGCIIGIGKGNKDWNYSAPHGAGRLMSRTEAFKKITLDEFKDSMKGIFTTSMNNETIDESPMAYKSMQDIIDCIGDTVDIIKIIKPVYNFKASN